MAHSAFAQEAAPVSEIVRFRLPHESTPGEEVILHGEAEVMGDEVNLLHVYAFRSRIADVGKSFWQELFPYAPFFSKDMRHALEQAGRESMMGGGWNGWLPCDATVVVDDITQKLWITSSRRLREVGGREDVAEIGLKRVEKVIHISDGRYIVEAVGGLPDTLKELALLAQ